MVEEVKEILDVSIEKHEVMISDYIAAEIKKNITEKVSDLKKLKLRGK